MHQSSATPFHPNPQAIDAILDDLADPALSFRDLAARHHTTPQALALFLSRPDIADRLNQTSGVVTWRTRHIASDILPKVIHTLTRVMDEFNNSTHTDPALRARAAESARRAATSILKLTTLPTPTLRPQTTTAAAAQSSSSSSSSYSSSSSLPSPSSPPPALPTSNVPLPTSLPPGLDLQTLLTMFNEEHAKLQPELAQSEAESQNTTEPPAPTPSPSNLKSQISSSQIPPPPSASSAPEFTRRGGREVSSDDLELVGATHEHWP